jgi:hypothetical protein
MYFTITRNSLTSPATETTNATTSNSVQLLFSTYIPEFSGALSTVTLSLAVTVFSLFSLML